MAGDISDVSVATVDLHKTYNADTRPVHALRGLDLQIPPGQFVVVRGRSGSGKTTLMHLLAGLQRPTSGEVWVGGTEIGGMNERQSARFRRRNIGVIYQFFNLVPTLGIEHNVALPLLMDGFYLSQVHDRVEAMMKRLGILDCRDRKTHELSGGQMQRVAIARSLIAGPVLVLADEPTGNLDSETGSGVLTLFRELNYEHEVTIVMMTHDPEATAFADRVLVLNDGLIQSDTAAPTGAGPVET